MTMLNTTLGFKKADLVSGPLNGVFNNRGKRLESAEWDLFFWRIPLISKERIYLGVRLKLKYKSAAVFTYHL